MDDDHFRIGDNDRRRALESLTSLAASGHLTVDEFDERSAAAAIARTRGDIKRLFDDIPGVDDGALHGGCDSITRNSLLAAACAAFLGLLLGYATRKISNKN